MDNNYVEYSPSDFVAVFNQSIEYAFSVVVIEGEISSFKVAKGRWVYFDIKDEGATLRCFGTVYMLPGPLEDGMMVRIVCSPRLHPQFNFSLNVQSIVPKGEGAIAKQAELLYKKLEAEGLFAPERKRRLPYPPEKIALITSTESAAYADFTKIISARWPYMSIDAYEVLVQGSSAPEQIAKAFEKVNAGGEPYEAVVLIRGGGSAEDLASFNDERVVRAVAGSRIPTVVAIGHEVDESLAELAADLRASTPSNAAELMVPEKAAESMAIESAHAHVISLFMGALSRSLYDLRHTSQALREEMSGIITDSSFWLATAKTKLEYANPRTILKRGYAMIRHEGKSLKSGKSLKNGDHIDIIFSDTTKKAVIHE